MGKSGVLDFRENKKSGRAFNCDSDDTKIVGLPEHGGGVDIKRP